MTSFSSTFGTLSESLAAQPALVIPEPQCECCCDPKAPVLGVISSSLGPCSFATCQACLVARAEPQYMVNHVLEETGLANLADWTQTMTVHFDGKYLSFAEYDVISEKD